MAGFAARAQRWLGDNEVTLLANGLAAQRFKIEKQGIGTNSREAAHTHLNAHHIGINGHMFRHLVQQIVDYRCFMHWQPSSSVIQHVEALQRFSLKSLAVVRVGNADQGLCSLAQAPAVKIGDAIFRYDVLGVGPRRNHTRPGL